MEIYYNEPKNPASYSWINKISHRSKTKQNTVSSALQGIETHSLHKPVKKKFNRSRVIVGGVNNQIDDLYDLTAYKQWNKGFYYILICIDVFSRKAMVQPLKSKNAAEVKIALEKILTKHKCFNLRTDAGNSLVAQLLKKLNISHFVARNTETKANYAERLQRTISRKLFKYFTQKNTYASVYIERARRTSYIRKETFKR